MPKFSDLGLLFVHIPKNAGRSIEAALLGHLSEKSGSPDGGRRSLLSRAGKGLLRAGKSSFAEQYLIGTIDHSFAAQHLTFAEMEMLGLLDDCAELRSFCVVRNPFDRAVSSVFHFREGGSAALSNPADFEAMLERWIDSPLTDHNLRAHRRPQADYVINSLGTRAVQDTLRFEQLETGFNALTKDAGLDGITLTPRGTSQRLDSYRDYYSPRAREIVEREFSRDLSMFEYAF